MTEILPVAHTSKWKKRRNKEKYLAYCFMNPTKFPAQTPAGDQLLLYGSNKLLVQGKVSDQSTFQKKDFLSVTSSA